jgi:hypothetical protein
VRRLYKSFGVKGLNLSCSITCSMVFVEIMNGSGALLQSLTRRCSRLFAREFEVARSIHLLCSRCNPLLPVMTSYAVTWNCKLHYCVTPMGIEKNSHALHIFKMHRMKNMAVNS